MTLTTSTFVQSKTQDSIQDSWVLENVESSALSFPHLILTFHNFSNCLFPTETRISCQITRLQQIEATKPPLSKVFCH